ncbi:type VI secretion system membrane subunit TssM [Burkholderia multivorans]|uniref:type VI secretion system membrane subunit TssM n=1 Tax=Burkholderia multivorans TaxID=87883 RepID=UPI000277F1CC|nr:type VI secretion system membrane subunit TssM [Burkholderia multivorans]EJO57759.1 type VI secretion protein IcmF [Burkholderia multivorans CF2]MBU9470155.1 type VI secretion system membrane subunit TssM [Burkholderia multivorans]
MKKILSFPSSRHLWAVVMVIAAVVVIWFAGPLLTFGGLSPLASIGIRLTLIALVLAAWALWLIDWTMSIVIIVLLCLAIWHAFPLVALSGKPLFASVTARILAMIGVVFVYAGVMSVRWWRQMRRHPGRLRRLLRLGKRGPRPLAASRLAEIEDMARATIAQLKAGRAAHGRLARLFRGAAHLYDVPWYVVLGPKGSGKTSMLLNSGLAFPLDARLQRSLAPDDARALPGWWLANEAVLIDTAGHYVQHGTSRYSLPVASSDGPSGGKRKNQPTDMAAVRRQSDAAEWHAFLRLLRRIRPRLPLNGVVLTIDVAALAHADPAAHTTESRALRARLQEMQAEFGTGFPVWLVVTKMDRLPGFTDYFASLGQAERAQILGVTLGSDQQARMNDAIRTELNLLATRLADGVTSLLRNETDMDKRRRLAVLPESVAALVNPLADLIEHVFARDDNGGPTQPHAMFRGVYLTSAIQGDHAIAAERRTLLRRMIDASGTTRRAARPARGETGYFLRDLWLAVVFREGHLASPNSNREHRVRLQRWLGHSLVWLIAAAMCVNLWNGFVTERTSLATLGQKARSLAALLARNDLSADPERVPTVLNHAKELLHDATHLATDADGTFRFATARLETIASDSRHVYEALSEQAVLPHIVRRMEDAIVSAVAIGDAQAAYDALRVYLMLHDRERFNANDVRMWVLDDWSRHDSAATFGGHAAMIGHVQRLFSEGHVVRSPLSRNDALIRQARVFLDGSDLIERLYRRAKATMWNDAPDDFSLPRMVGTQAGMVFTRVSGAPLSGGVPGIFTREGYQAVFSKRLPEFLRVASDDDAWVMGRRASGDPRRNSAGTLNAPNQDDDALLAAVTRRYLLEYAQQWDAFLGDIRIVSGTSLAFNLKILRTLAAPDSPLTRLARAAVIETTLTQPMAKSDGAFLAKATDAIHQKAETILVPRASEQLEREWVDRHFAALREVVTGHADTRSDTQRVETSAGRTGLDGIADLLNDYYTALAIADNALLNNSMPPASEHAAKLKMMADTMPAPLRAVLHQLAVEGSRGVNQGIGRLLSRQVQAAIGDVCRTTIEGNYPFSPDSSRDVGIDDFARMFAHGGVIDDFFTRTLAPFVDTAAKPWRYRTLPGATEPVHGPDLAPFEHAKAIRDIFFNEVDRTRPSWKVDIRIPELDPTIMSLSLDIDGQTTRYRHGPVEPFTVTWPGPRGGAHAWLVASPSIGPNTSTIAADGPWALMRLLRKGRVIETATLGRTRVVFSFDGREAALDIASAGSVANPLTSDVLATFRCPGTMAMFNLPDSGPPVGLPRESIPAISNPMQKRISMSSVTAPLTNQR